MIKIFWFLFGFFISVAFGCYGYASDCGDISGLSVLFPDYHNSGHYSSQTDAVNGCFAAYDSFNSSLSCPFGKNVLRTDGNLGVENGVSYYRLYADINCCDSSCVTTRYYFVATYGALCPCSPDSDSDGLPDHLDVTAGSDPYQFRILTNYYDTDGNCVGQLIVTSSGDYHLLGDLTSDEINSGVSSGTYTSQYINSPSWIESDDLKNDSTENNGGVYSEGTGSPTGVSSTDAGPMIRGSSGNVESDTSFGTGVGASDGDTDSQSFGKIADNTAKTVDGLGKVSGYMRQLNDAVSNINGGGAAVIGSGIASDGDGTIDDDLGSESDDQDAQAGKTALENLDVGAYYNSTNYTGELVEGIDYQAVEGLGEQSWFSDFMTSNPYKTALDSSGFECNNAACEMTLTLPAPLNGEHKLSICEFDDGFRAAGTLFLSLTTLGGFVMLARG